VLSKFAVTRVVIVFPDPGDPRATAAASVPITATPTVAATHLFFERNTRKTFSSPLEIRPRPAGIRSMMALL
jgi:mRNA-degrading endonuclease toxin of MazEF toxin-antitoxin module